MPCTKLRGIVTTRTSTFQEGNIFSLVCLSYQGRSQYDRSRPVQTCSLEDQPPPSLFQLVYLGIPPLAPTWDPDLLESGSLALDCKASLLTLTIEVHEPVFGVGVGVGLGQCESAITHGKLSFHRSASRQNEDWCIELLFTPLYANRQLNLPLNTRETLNRPIMLQILGKTADVTGLVPQCRNKTSRISEITIFYQNQTTQF